MSIRALALAALLVAACDDPAAPEDVVALSISGTFELRTIKGQPLPWTLAQGATSRTEITAGQIVLAADSTFSRVTHRRITDQNGVAESVIIQSGTYSRSDSGTVDLYMEGSMPIVGTLDGRWFAASFAGCCEVYRYERQ